MMKALMVIAAFGAIGTLADPAHAIDGRTALDQCTANPECRVRQDADGGTVIQSGGRVIYCPPEGLGECQVVYRRGGKVVADAEIPLASETATAGEPAGGEGLAKN